VGFGGSKIFLARIAPLNPGGFAPVFLSPMKDANPADGEKMQSEEK
jgi:hypothetical protein